MLHRLAALRTGTLHKLCLRCCKLDFNPSQLLSRIRDVSQQRREVLCVPNTTPEPHSLAKSSFCVAECALEPICRYNVLPCLHSAFYGADLSPEGLSLTPRRRNARKGCNWFTEPSGIAVGIACLFRVDNLILKCF